MNEKTNNSPPSLARTRLERWYDLHDPHAPSRRSAEEEVSLEDLLEIRTASSARRDPQHHLLMHKCLFLVGETGVGKTTLVNNLCESKGLQCQHIDCCLFGSFAEIRRQYLEAVGSQSLQQPQPDPSPAGGLCSFFKPRRAADGASAAPRDAKPCKKLYHLTGIDVFLQDGPDRLIKSIIELVDKSGFPFVVEVEQSCWAKIVAGNEAIDQELDLLLVDKLQESDGCRLLEDTLKDKFEAVQAGAQETLLEPHMLKVVWDCFDGNISKLMTQIGAVFRHSKPKSVPELQSCIDHLVRQELRGRIRSFSVSSLTTAEVWQIGRVYPSLRLLFEDRWRLSAEEERTPLSAFVEAVRLIDRYKELDKTSRRLREEGLHSHDSPEGWTQLSLLRAADDKKKRFMLRRDKSACFRDALSRMIGRDRELMLDPFLSKRSSPSLEDDRG